MPFSFRFQPYQRRFRQPLHTSHGIWEIREGIIVSLHDRASGIAGYGEIAPIPWFGSETLEQAIEFCQDVHGEISIDRICNIPDYLPACQFAFESALANLSPSNSSSSNLSQLPISYLLPTGKAALTQWQNLQANGAVAFKWKIGVGDVIEEIKLLRQLRLALPRKVKLRLDANGGLSAIEARKWLEAIDDCGGIEFLEQPFPVDRFDDMLALSCDYRTTLALDESVANLDRLQNCYDRGWRGVFVIKAAIAGSPRRLQDFCASNPVDLVFSSVFETDIGKNAVFSLARSIGKIDRPLGFGIDLFCE